MGSTKILLVEDDKNIKFNIKSMLELEDYEVVDVENGSSAFVELGKQSYNLIITDIMMVNMDGLELLALIRKNKLLKNIPVILVTAKSIKELPEMIFDSKCFFLGKPFSYDHLLETVKIALS